MGALGAGGDEDWYRTLSLEEDYRARQVFLGFNFLKKDALLQTKGSQQLWMGPRLLLLGGTRYGAEGKRGVTTLGGDKPRGHGRLFFSLPGSFLLESLLLSN